MCSVCRQKQAQHHGSTSKTVSISLLDILHLHSLQLTESGLTAAAVSELARGDWPDLFYLEFTHVDLDAVCVLLGLTLDKVQALKSSA